MTNKYEVKNEIWFLVSQQHQKTRPLIVLKVRGNV